MITTTLTAPAYWADYLINDDAEGLQPGDLAACRAWLAEVGMGMPVSCEDAGYSSRHDASEHMDLGGDIALYTFGASR